MVLIIFATALFLRVVFVILQIKFSIFDASFEAADSSLYRVLAENLSRSGEFQREVGQPTAYVTPGYPLFLAALFMIGRSTLFIALVQSVLGAGTAVLVALTAEGLENKSGFAAGLSAGLAAALYPHLIFWTGYVATETLYVFLLMAAVFVLSRIQREGRPAWWMCLGAGALFGAAALVRPTILGFPLLLAVAGLFLSRWRRIAAVGLAGLALVLAPWVVRNMVVLDAPIVTSSESGYVLWQGNSPEATGGTRGYVDTQDFEPLEFGAQIGEVERDAIYGRKAISWMLSHPDEVAGLIPNKLWNMFRPVYEGASLFNQAVTYLSYLPLMMIGAYGLFLLRGKGVFGWTLISLVVYHLLVHGLVTGMIRFRLPVEAVLTIPFGIAISQLLGRDTRS